MDYRQSKILISLWKNFVKTGNPSTEDVEWDPITDIDTWSYLNIEVSSVMERSKDVTERMKFWDNLLNLTNSSPQKLLGNTQMTIVIFIITVMTHIISK